MKEKAFLGASILAAVAASLCCALPLIAAIAGIGVAGVSGFFAAWRPYLLGVTAILLALGFYFSYRRQKQGSCEPGSACERPAAGRYGRLGLWLATVFVVLFAAFPYYSPALSRRLSGKAAQAATPAFAVQHVSFAVQGMTCPVCAQGVEHRLNSMQGVTKASVSYEHKNAEIDFDPRLVKPEQLEQPFKDAGFQAVRRSAQRRISVAWH
jgi:mercuric ion transport protein